MVNGSSSPATFSRIVPTERFTPFGPTGMASISSLTRNSPSKIGQLRSLRTGSASCSLPIADIPTAWVLICSRCVSMSRIATMLAREKKAANFGAFPSRWRWWTIRGGNRALAPRDVNERVSDDQACGREFQQLLGDRGRHPGQTRGGLARRVRSRSRIEADADVRRPLTKLPGENAAARPIVTDKSPVVVVTIGDDLERRFQIGARSRIAQWR